MIHKNYFKVRQKFVSKWVSVDNLYFKVKQGLFQIGAETVMSKWANVYFKVGHNKCFDNNFTKFTLVKKIQFKQLKIC